MTAVEELERLGVALGDLRWVQGPGGNVSIKDDGTLHVKASGVRLRSVGTNFASVPLSLAERALEGDAAADAAVFSRAPRPSLETYFHVLGSRVVAHTHAVGMLLVACASAQSVALDVVTIPYERPGRGIALAIQKAFDGRAARGGVLLAGHGLIVFADSVDEAIDRTRALDDGARAAFGRLPDIEALHEAYVGEGLETAIEGGHARPLPRRDVSARFLFPDAVVYAGCVRVDAVGVDAAAHALKEIPRPSILFDGAGRRMVVARTKEQLAYAVEVACAHDWVEDALALRKLLHYLPEDEPARILDLPAEKYRLKL